MLDTTHYMTCRVTVQDILPMLALFHRIVERRTTLPILASVLFRGDGTVVATDLDLEATWRLAGTEGVHPFTIPLDTLQKAVKGAGKGGFMEFALEAVADEPAAKVTVTVDGMRSRVNALPEADFPIMRPAEGDATVFRMPQSDLYEWLSFIQPCISDEATRYYLNGILVHSMNNKLTGVATNGHVLALREAGGGEFPWESTDEAGNRGGVIVPRVSCLLCNWELVHAS